ncbi:hypothetical protein DVA67_012805 [Solirubrobacter sp. CPCC 204708]|uniref:Uncharacterized protein n=1 Tax=Solirubrobacter deserti TaxID=2282478 RepID=A0ABT4RKE4_9ACTN|nr:hypothetical protein [Solirubrobacter deserti]MBE2316855.1 hypothetical protein [Solirubrobacter deserti]MDA0138928.1 hypothetical protein [Solirubrobacter deserti]
MGLLDDAIREHLELKRKHGADPEDLARQEREALGPGMRNEFAQKPEQEAEPAQEPVAAAEEPQPPMNEEPPAAVSLNESEIGQEEDPWLADERDEVPADEALQSRPAGAQGEDDVLEETPEFLQETPEHDRLWFEQKPPRDFDWDK